MSPRQERHIRLKVLANLICIRDGCWAFNYKESAKIQEEMLTFAIEKIDEKWGLIRTVDET